MKHNYTEEYEKNLKGDGYQRILIAKGDEFKEVWALNVIVVDEKDLPTQEFYYFEDDEEIEYFNTMFEYKIHLKTWLIIFLF